MSLNNIIRRVSMSKVVPLALRYASGIQRYHHQCSAIFSAVNRRSSSYLCGIIDRRSIMSEFQPYCSLAAVDVDNTIVSVLEQEIYCAKKVEVEGAYEDFPFKIIDIPSQFSITLSRDYQGEKITVAVGLPAHQDEDISESFKFPFVVRVDRNKKSCLEFGCDAFADEIAIYSVSLKDPCNPEEDEQAYDGPVFSTLDKKLQMLLLKYLEVRGIKPSMTNFLYEYMVEKDSREYLLWLNNMKEFMEP